MRVGSPASTLLCGVTLGRAHEDLLVLDEVLDLHHALGDFGQRLAAAVLHEPPRPAHGRRAVLAAGAERTSSIAPQLARLRLLLRGGGHLAAWARQRFDELELGDPAGEL